jgi:hypothetical protein
LAGAHPLMGLGKIETGGSDKVEVAFFWLVQFLFLGVKFLRPERIRWSVDLNFIFILSKVESFQNLKLISLLQL